MGAYPGGVRRQWVHQGRNTILQVQPDQLYIAVLFWYLLKSDLSSVRYCSIAYTGHCWFLDNTFDFYGIYNRWINWLYPYDKYTEMGHVYMDLLRRSIDTFLLLGLKIQGKM